jgi:hypothetical protein
MPGVQLDIYYVTIIHNPAIFRRTIMSRRPMTWTAVHLALASAATWFLLESGALSSALLFSFH